MQLYQMCLIMSLTESNLWKMALENNLGAKFQALEEHVSRFLDFPIVMD